MPEFPPCVKATCEKGLSHDLETNDHDDGLASLALRVTTNALGDQWIGITGKSCWAQRAQQLRNAKWAVFLEPITTSDRI